MQHIASGFGAYLGGIIITQGVNNRIEHFGTVGLIAGASTLFSLWLAGRVKIVDQLDVSAEKLSLAAAAEASVDAGEPLMDAVEKA